MGDQLKQNTVLLREGFSSEETRGAYQVWNFIGGALQSEADRSILNRCKSPREVFDHLEKWYDPENEVATQKLFDKFHDFTIPPNSNPIEALHALEGMNNQMVEKGVGIPDTFLHTHFVCALSDKNGHAKATLQAMRHCDRAEIIRMVGTRYSTLPQRKASQRSSWPPEQTFFSRKRGDRSSARRGHGRVAGAPTAVTAAGAATKVEVTGAEEAAATPAVVATAAVVDLLAAVGDATGGTTSGRRAPQRRATSSLIVLDAPVLSTRKAHAYRTRQCWRWSCRCQKRISSWKLRRLWRRKQTSAV